MLIKREVVSTSCTPLLVVLNQQKQQQQHLFIRSDTLVLKLIKNVLAAYSNHNGWEKVGGYPWNTIKKKLQSCILNIK